MARHLLVVRHPPVADAWRGICYGTSDAALGPAGRERVPALVAETLAHGPISSLFHSGLSRCADVAEAIAAAAGLVAVVDHRLRERSFGAWERRPWDAIHAETGDAMLGMLHEPETWRPPGGETTFEMRDRIMAWFHHLPREGRIVAVTHGGPIAALRGTLAAAPVERWPQFVPACGEIVVVREDDPGRPAPALSPPERPR